jgi:hypothetical protein
MYSHLHIRMHKHIYARRSLAGGAGNEFGEPVQEERKIRIGDMPRPNRMDAATGSTVHAHRTDGCEVGGGGGGCGGDTEPALATTAAASKLNQASVGDDNPLAAWADPKREAEPEPENIVASLAKVHGDHDEQRKAELVQKAPPGCGPAAGAVCGRQRPGTDLPYTSPKHTHTDWTKTLRGTTDGCGVRARKTSPTCWRAT